MNETMTVYRDDTGTNHLPSDNPAMVKCGLDTEWMQKREHPISHAAMWCHLCFKTAIGGDDEQQAS